MRSVLPEAGPAHFCEGWRRSCCRPSRQLLGPAPAAAATRDVWVAAVPKQWNAVPNARDAIHGTRFEPAETTFPTVVYRRYTRGWKRPLRMPYEARRRASTAR